MKKLLILIALAIGIFFYNNQQLDEPINAAPVTEHLLRFHVIANSDSPTDQQIKLKIRDQILRNMDPKLHQATDLDSAKKIAATNLKVIEGIANLELKKAGFPYQAKASLGEYDFPTKSYGTFVLPAGKYQAVRIQLGRAEGKNWWCVLFPPLCFVDITQSLATNPGMMTTEAFSIAKQSGLVKTENQTKVEIRFKTLEIIKELFK